MLADDSHDIYHTLFLQKIGKGVFGALRVNLFACWEIIHDFLPPAVFCSLT